MLLLLPHQCKSPLIESKYNLHVGVSDEEQRLALHYLALLAEHAGPPNPVTVNLRLPLLTLSPSPLLPFSSAPYQIYGSPAGDGPCACACACARPLGSGYEDKWLLYLLI